jgi:sporulation-control protein
MGFLKNMLASIGIGATKIDAQLFQNQVSIGQSIQGEIQISGGNVEQQIQAFELILYTQAEKETDDSRYYVTLPVQKIKLNETITVQPGAVHAIPFEIAVPLHTPISFGKVQVWLGTEAEIANAIDPKDRDYVEVLPHPSQLAVLQAVEQLGFRLMKCDNEYKSHVPFSYEQEFEYAPSSEFRSHLDELEIAFDLKLDRVVVKLTIDRRARGLGSLLNEMAGTDDRRVLLTISHDEIEAHGVGYVKDALRETIHRYKR